MKRLGRLAATAILLASLAAPGCASAPAALPAAFPFHADEQQFSLHWRLRPEADQTRAEGLVARHHPDISDAWLQLVGLDATGRIVSFSTAVHVRWTSSWDTESFVATLKPTGAESRFAVQVRAFSYEEGAPTHS
jgi:hypothetical protein